MSLIAANKQMDIAMLELMKLAPYLKQYALFQQSYCIQNEYVYLVTGAGIKLANISFKKTLNKQF